MTRNFCYADPLEDVPTYEHTNLLKLRKVPSVWPSRFRTGLIAVSFLGIAYSSIRLAALAVRFAASTPVGKEWLTRYIDYVRSFTTQPSIPGDTIRATFNKLPPVSMLFQDKVSHTHAVSAQTRNASGSIIDLAASMMGKVPYYLQKSRYDERRNRAGCRTYHWGRDLTVASAQFAPPEDSVLALVDVDHYMDIPHLLAQGDHALLISTFQPSAVAQAHGDYSFTFNAQSEVEYSVSGGAKFSHLVWNYGTDTLASSASMWWGLYHVMTTYTVDKKNLDAHHELILLTPMTRLVHPFFSLAPYLGHHVLSRFNLVVGEFLRLAVQLKSGIQVSTGKVRKFLNSMIPVEMDDTLASLVAINKTDLSPALVKITIGNDDPVIATVLTEYHRQGKLVRRDVSYPSSAGDRLDDTVSHYQYDPSSFDPDAKTSVTAFMCPLFLGCSAPVKSKSNDQRAIKSRVVDVAVFKPLTPWLLQCICEFAEFLVPNSKLHTGGPVDLDYVYEKQDRPTQRRILDEASLTTVNVDDSPLKSFQKSETYGEIKEPRIITTFPGTTKMNYSRFIYSFSARLREFEWYAFGKTPAEISRRVATIAMAAKTIINTDLSKCDGHVSNVARILYQIILLRFFNPLYHTEIIELFNAQSGNHAISRFGVNYHTGTSQCSGGSDTADMNSTLNACMAYSTKRRNLKPVEAWCGLGLYGGDDGITADVDPKDYIRTCLSYGQKLDADTVARGKFGVNFLSRYYSPEVWFGSEHSMCDLRRQLLKLHVTPNLPANVTPIQKLGEKIFSYSLTDANTPILCDLIRIFKKKYGAHLPVQCSLGVSSWFANYDLSDQFPNEDVGQWMDEYMLKFMKDFDCVTFQNWINSIDAGTISILESPGFEPLPERLVSKHDVVVNGDIIRGNAVVNKSLTSRDFPSLSPIPELNYSETDSTYSPSSPRCVKDHKHDFKTCVFSQPPTQELLSRIYNTNHPDHIKSLLEIPQHGIVVPPLQQSGQVHASNQNAHVQSVVPSPVNGRSNRNATLQRNNTSRNRRRRGSRQTYSRSGPNNQQSGKDENDKVVKRAHQSTVCVSGVGKNDANEENNERNSKRVAQGGGSESIKSSKSSSDGSSSSTADTKLATQISTLNIDSKVKSNVAPLSVISTVAPPSWANAIGTGNPFGGTIAN